jgi:hypothetical protein
MSSENNQMTIPPHCGKFFVFLLTCLLKEKQTFFPAVIRMKTLQLIVPQSVLLIFTLPSPNPTVSFPFLPQRSEIFSNMNTGNGVPELH